MTFTRSLGLAFFASISACAPSAPTDPSAPAPSSSGSEAAAPEDPGAACLRSYEALAGDGRAYGSGKLEQDREDFLGRARGAVNLFVREPNKTVTSDTRVTASRERFDKDPKGYRLSKLLARHKHDKPGLRAIVLREGYLYADTPEDAFELESKVKLTDLFEEPNLVLERGSESFALVRKKEIDTFYAFESGPQAGKRATVLFGDRVRLSNEPATPPLSRDILRFARDTGIDRMTVDRVSETRLRATLHLDELDLRAVIHAEGAKLTLGCIAEPKEKRDAVAARIESHAWRRGAEARMRLAIDQAVDEALPFDRPRDEKGPDKDGTLRPHWFAAYQRGSHTFEFEDQTYPVFLSDGRPAVPTVCVDFVIDTFERAAGSWYAPRGEARGRKPGRLSIQSLGIENARGVLGFGAFAESRPDLFDFRRYVGQERIPFEKRAAFFDFLLSHRDEFKAGDVIAIHGLKRDERIHQHAILLEYVDPITGFPVGLADQMKNPRRRTWEGIMAEAPKRSLLFRARPLPAVLKPLSDGSEAPRTALAKH